MGRGQHTISLNRKATAMVRNKMTRALILGPLSVVGPPGYNVWFMCLFVGS